MDRHDKIQNDGEGVIESLPTSSRTLDTFGVVVFVVVVVEIILMVGLNLYQKSRLASIETQLNDYKSQLNSPDNRTINTEVDQVLSGANQLKSALASKVDWGKFYDQLNKVTPKDVRISSISISDNGSFKADGETTSLSSLGKALVAWQQGTDSLTSPFLGVTLASDSFTTDGGNRRVTFSISGQVNTGALR